MLSTGVWVRGGISSTKVLAKMATDNFAKKSESGIFTLLIDQIESILWPRPVSQMYMVGSRMTADFMRMGRQSDIQSEYYWQTGRGIDPSPVVAGKYNKPKSITRGRALRWQLYKTFGDIEPLLLELVIEVCRTSRRYNSKGRVVTVSAGTTNGVSSKGFSRQTTLPNSSCLEQQIVGNGCGSFAVIEYPAGAICALGQM